MNLKIIVFVFAWSVCATLQIHAGSADGWAMAVAKPIHAPLRATTNHPNYFTDGNGRAVYLTGSHTWNDFQDWGTDDFPQPFEFGRM